jgi:two-component SAPR family response regulator
MKSGPIIVVEDDVDDQGIFAEILSEIGIKNELIWFTHSSDVIDYLKTTTDKPFIIFSDVNLPGQNGIEFKRQMDLDPQLRKKSIPFVFYSTSVDQRAVNEAYTHMTVQGFFQKGSSYDEMKKDISLILGYWEVCKHPNSA